MNGHATVLAGCFAAGVGIGQVAAPGLFPAWVAAGLLSAIAAIAIPSLRSRRRLRAFLIALGSSVFFLGAAWTTLRVAYAAPDDLAARLGPEPALVHLRGAALDEPVARRRAAGSMARFDHSRPMTVFRLRVEAILDDRSIERPARGIVIVRVAQTVAPFRAGDGIIVSGFLSPPSPPRNPGGYDGRAAARARGEAGVLHVTDRNLVRVTPHRHGWRRSIRSWRERLQARANEWLRSDLSALEHDERGALLAALLLGQRDHSMSALNDSFRRVGLAHLLAISGLHLGVLAGSALLLLRWHGHARAWHGLAIVVIVIGYLFVVETRLPVLRAGLMAIAAGLALASRRRLPVSSLIALSGLVLLAWRPSQLFEPGFQLSYGVVIGLMHLVTPVRRRWFGPPRSTIGSSAEMAGQWLASTIVVAVVAWAVATPITILHFGMIAPLAVPLSVIALPIVFVLLTLGFAKMACAALLPSLSLLLGAILAIGADLLIDLVTVADALPGSVIYVPKPSPLWSLAALVLVGWWGRAAPAGLGRVRGPRSDAARAKRGARLAGVARVGSIGVLLAWLWWPVLPVRATPALRVDMLAVGNGTCILVRSGRSAALFDAGSSSDLDAGRRTIVPALRALGVRRLEFLAISHPNLDHFSAVLEVVDAFDLRLVLVTPQFTAAAEAPTGGPAAFLLDQLARRDVPVKTCAAGTSRALGRSNWRWLHPGAEDRFGEANDAAMVIAIETGAGRSARRVLLTGDIQTQAIGVLARRYPALAADVVELPHHGSFNAAALDFVRRLAPSVALQSTGRARLRHDRWAGVLPGVERIVTASGGAAWVEINDRGAIRTGCFAGAAGPATQSSVTPRPP